MNERKSSNMGLKNESLWVIVILWFFLFMNFGAYCHSSDLSVKFLKTPPAFSNKNSAKFRFQVFVNGEICQGCTTNCKLDDGLHSSCGNGRTYYTMLQDGNHSFEVCANSSGGFGCANYDWIIDRVHPTAYITAATSFTNASNVPVNITFTEPCVGGGGGFQCSSTNACNILVYGAGQIVPDTLKVIRPNLEYSLTVNLSTTTQSQYGRVVVIMDKGFCTDAAGNRFLRTNHSSVFIHFDRRDVMADIRTHIPEKLLRIDSETRTVLATNKTNNLKVYLYFNQPVLNTSSEIMNSLNTTQGSLVPIHGNDFGNRRFGFQVKDLSQIAIVTVSFHANSIISRQGTPVSPLAPVTFLYDSQRPAVRLSTTSSTRTRDKYIPILVKFMKPVFGFNSSHVSFSGGQVRRFHELSKSMYTMDVQAEGGIISITIPENVTEDVSGNGNLPSNVLQLRHYSLPMISLALSSFTTAAIAVTSIFAGFLTVSTASLQCQGIFTRQSPFLVSEPTRNLFRMVSHIQVFALSRWLAVTLPVEYYEFARGLQWSIPYFNLPWEKPQAQSYFEGSNLPANPHPFASKIYDSGIYLEHVVRGEQTFVEAATAYGLPLTPMEYRTFFEGENMLPEAQYILDPQNSHGWRNFKRSMFWLAVIYLSLLVLHLLILLILKYRKKSTGKNSSYGALVFPRFEIFLLILALPCICEASAALVKGGASSGIVVGILLLGAVFCLLMALLLFLSAGITLGKLLQYKEIHQEGQKFHWYQELIRVTLGPGKRGQWTWRNQPKSVYLTILGPLFEDLRGPPKYMLSQFATGSSSSSKLRHDRIMASDDETEDAEAPFIQKLFGILRIYYTLIETVKRVTLGIVAGAYSENWSARTPTLALLSITSFQLFFMVLKKPFIKKKVQLVEIISVFSELVIFACCMAILERNNISTQAERVIGIFMLSFSSLSLLIQILNECYSLYKQTKQLDPAAASSNFLSGLKMASIGFLLLFIPRTLLLIKDMDGGRFPVNNNSSSETKNTPSSGERRSAGSRSSGEKPWLKQIREMARGSFVKEGSGISGANDPSSSNQGKWSGFWNVKRSESSQMNSSSSDYNKSKSSGLYKDLEAIFASSSSSK